MSAIKGDVKQSFLIFFHVLKCSFYCYSLLYLIDYFFTDLDIWGYNNNYNAFIFTIILIFGPTSYFYIDYLLMILKTLYYDYLIINRYTY